LPWVKELALYGLLAFIGILRNETADILAKRNTLISIPSSRKIPGSDVIPILRKYIKTLWDQNWSFQPQEYARRYRNIVSTTPFVLG